MKIIDLIDKYLIESDASEQAKKLKLTSAGWGKWKNAQGKVTHKTVDGKLVKIDDKAENPTLNDLSTKFDEIYHLIDWSKKPGRWKNVNEIPLSELQRILSTKEKNIGLKEFELSDVMTSDNGPTTTFSKKFALKAPQYFIMKKDGKRYLIDTQGYEYARYIIEIK